MKRGTAVTVLFVVLLGAAVLLAIGALWWWALLGMDPHVGTAAWVSAAALGLGAFVVGVVRWGS